MKTNLKIFFTAGIIGCLLACTSGSENSGKNYVNLRYTKNSSLFTCKTTSGESGSFRGLREGDEETGIWKIEEFSDRDVKELANKYCKVKFGEIK